MAELLNAMMIIVAWEFGKETDKAFKRGEKKTGYGFAVGTLFFALLSMALWKIS